MYSVITKKIPNTEGGVRLRGSITRGYVMGWEHLARVCGNTRFTGPHVMGTTHERHKSLKLPPIRLTPVTDGSSRSPMDAFSVLRVILSLVLSVAVVLAVMFLVFGFRHRINTRLCSLLLRSQTIIDLLLMLVNLINIQYFELLPVPAQTRPDSLWQAYCKLIYSEILHWSLVCMSVYNLVCLAVERCCCLCAPLWYRSHQQLLIGTFATIVLASPFIVEVPYCLLVTVFVRKSADPFWSNRTANETLVPAVLKACELNIENEPMLKGFGAAYAILFWVLPSALSVTLYLLIMREIRRSRALRDASARGGGNLDGATKRLTLMTCITSGAFVLLFAMDSIGYLLYCAGVRIEKRGLIDSVDSFLLTLNSTVNPMLYLIFLPEFRSFVACAYLRKRFCFSSDYGNAMQCSHSESLNAT